jgi:hypothetical protein
MLYHQYNPSPQVRLTRQPRHGSPVRANSRKLGLNPSERVREPARSVLHGVRATMSIWDDSFLGVLMFANPRLCMLECPRPQIILIADCYGQSIPVKRAHETRIRRISSPSSSPIMSRHLRLPACRALWVGSTQRNLTSFEQPAYGLLLWIYVAFLSLWTSKPGVCLTPSQAVFPYTTPANSIMKSSETSLVWLPTCLIEGIQWLYQSCF